MTKKSMLLLLVLLMALCLISCMNPYKNGVDYSDFPKRDLPIYDDSVVYYFEEDDDVITIKYGSIDDVDDIIDFYEDEFEDDDYIIIDLDVYEDECQLKGYVDELSFEIEIDEAKGEKGEYFDSLVEIKVVENDLYETKDYKRFLNTVKIREEINDEVFEAQESYLDDNGFIPEENIEDALSEVMDVAKEKYNDGTVTYYEEGINCVYMELSSGIGYVYTPNVEGYDASGDKLKIATYQPFQSDYINEWGQLYNLITKRVDDSAVMIEENFTQYSFNNKGGNDSNYDDDEVNFKALDAFSEYSIILWHGHGGYTDKAGPYLVTGIINTCEFEYENWEDFEYKRLIVQSDGRAIATQRYFDHYLDDNSLDGSLVYLGACLSGADDRLANVFINKGAEVVIANSGVIRSGYNTNMIKTIISEMCKLNGNSHTTVAQALEIAKDKHGNFGGGWGTTYVRIIGNGDYALGMSPMSDFTENKEEEEVTHTISSDSLKDLGFVKDTSGDYIYEKDEWYIRRYSSSSYWNGIAFSYTRDGEKYSVHYTNPDEISLAFDNRQDVISCWYYYEYDYVYERVMLYEMISFYDGEQEFDIAQPYEPTEHTIRTDIEAVWEEELEYINEYCLSEFGITYEQLKNLDSGY